MTKSEYVIKYDNEITQIKTHKKRELKNNINVIGILKYSLFLKYHPLSLSVFTKKHSSYSTVGPKHPTFLSQHDVWLYISLIRLRVSVI